MHEVLVNRLGGLSRPRKSVVRLTDRLDMTLDVYRGRKTTIQSNTIQSPLIKEVENVSGDPWHFPAKFIPKYLTGCISHCFIVGGYLGIEVYIQ